MHISILAVGSRGDVQPCLALGLGLRQAGHAVRIIAPDDSEQLIRSRGIEFRPLGLDVHGMQQSLRRKAILGANILSGVREMVRVIVPFVRQMTERTRKEVEGSDRIVYSSLGSIAYHVAETMGVPCAWALTIPVFTRTSVFPSLLTPALPLGGVYNRLTHVLSEAFAQLLAGGMVNRLRREILDLPPLPLHRWPYGTLAGRPVARLYSISGTVLPRPADWDADAHMTGYWFLDRPPDWQPPSALADFLDEGEPPVYIGFGSLMFEDAEKKAEIVLEALRRCGLRGVLARGWGGLESADLPRSAILIDEAPHDWLFPQMAAVVHHGGAGTTAAGLRAGVPSVLVPFGLDQPFWGRCVQQLGAGPKPVPGGRLTADRLAQALQRAVADPAIRSRAAEIGRRLRAEDGVAAAVGILENLP